MATTHEKQLIQDPDGGVMGNSYSDEELLPIVDQAAQMRSIIDNPRVDPITKGEARLVMFCLGLFGDAIGVRFDTSKPAQC